MNRVVLKVYNEDQRSRNMKKRPSRRNSNAHHKRLQPQIKKWKKSGVPTNHGDEDTRRTSLNQEQQGKALRPLHRRTSKVRQHEYQKKRQSTKWPGEKRRIEYSPINLPVGPRRRRQLQVIQTKLYRFILYSFKQVVGRIIADKQVTVGYLKCIAPSKS
ncbi:hypothetical protein TNCV_4395221 [Trichonephila clavipes]|uniref:Uncharacterized protein n=1 Tax=Trichonephila clavipes TaxID=2585209 RepID=A0A8X7BEA2_TRICX|nr:hypothetical protein TNCV_4395221 [Trichonephila clavipes]